MMRLTVDGGRLLVAEDVNLSGSCQFSALFICLGFDGPSTAYRSFRLPLLLTSAISTAASSSTTATVSTSAAISASTSATTGFLLRHTYVR